MTRLASVEATGEHLPTGVGPYRIDTLLGVGGMGRVYRAYDERLDRYVALKQISGSGQEERARERFRREARAAARLNHPAIVQIYDVLAAQGADWIVMELVDGENLSTILRQGPLEVLRAVESARDVSCGLTVAHGEGIVHRDLKSENVMLVEDGGAKILDFGLAKRLVSDTDASVSVEGTLLGTARAMSPEQPLGKAVDHRSDLFSFGTLLYEMLTGRSPFLGPTAVETAIRVCSHVQTPVCKHNPLIPKDLSDLVDHLLEKEPASRPDSAKAVSLELEHIARSLSQSQVTVPAGTENRLEPEPEIADFVSTPAEPELGKRKAGLRQGLQSHERRRITVLCCDLVNADAGALPLDPETLSDVTQEFLVLVQKAIQPFSGHFGPVFDHRMVVYFGYPRAFEDDARRAVHAALAIIAEVAGLDRSREVDGGPRLAVRIGIHTGLAVVMTSQGEPERVILGETLDVASEIQHQARPGEVEVSAATERLVRGFFSLENLPPVRLRGSERTTKVCRVTDTVDLRSPVELTEDLAPLVGRQVELALLADRWQLARDGNGQAVLVSGEAGIGKSRLIGALFEQTASDVCERLVTFGSPYTRRSPFHPLIKILHRLLEFVPADEPEKQRADLERFLQRFDLAEESVVEPLAQLLALPAKERPEDQPMRTEETIEALLAIFQGLAERAPVLLVVEDLHWIDASTLEFLTKLLPRIIGTHLLAVFTFRPGSAPSWSLNASLTQLTLNRLTSEQAKDLIGQHCSDVKLPRDTREKIAARADGIPLFVEELTKSVLETLETAQEASSSDPMGVELPIPATLHASLMARLDRLGPAKELAQLAAALGREFSHELLTVVSALEPEALESQLTRLLAAELLLRRGVGSRIKYHFKHSLIQEAAYQSLLKKERQALHERIAGVLENWAEETREIQSEVLAHHYFEAGDVWAAAEHWLRAGKQAIERTVSLEAIEHLERGLELVDRLPEGDARDRMELALLTTLGPVLSNLKGFEGTELERIYTRAGELCLAQDDEAHHFWVLRGISAFFITRARPRQALRLVEKLAQIADAADEDGLRLESRYALGLTHFSLGDLSEARQQLEAGILLDGAGPAELRDLEKTSEDPGIACRSVLALVLWHQGFPDRAVDLSEEALDRARALEHANTLAETSSLAAWLRQLRRDRPEVEALAGETIRISQDGGFLFWATYGELLHGWSKANLDSATSDPRPEGRLGLSLEVYRDAGVLFAQTYLLSLLAEVAAHSRDLDSALRHLLEALTAVESTGERFWQAELLRLCGDLLLIAAADSEGERRQREAESYFERAFDLAQRQGARSLELRAALSLGRAWALRGLGDEGRRLVRSVYEGFSEGFETEDLVRARRWIETT